MNKLNFIKADKPYRSNTNIQAGSKYNSLCCPFIVHTPSLSLGYLLIFCRKLFNECIRREPVKGKLFQQGRQLRIGCCA